ncbi:hypothetical protein E2C01_083281 [Portunus trituberculatus]|uniref:Uncharacterized protein n=1 Tax=Portunus trituberculatus TaxID=210409 RepID=A0A5B7IUQ5_PORTR|nr:hypothetical protein [Portunus trituberculatus]
MVAPTPALSAAGLEHTSLSLTITKQTSTQEAPLTNLSEHQPNGDITLDSTDVSCGDDLLSVAKCMTRLWSLWRQAGRRSSRLPHQGS